MYDTIVNAPEYNPNDISNLDETALFFKMQPNNTLSTSKQGATIIFIS